MALEDSMQKVMPTLRDRLSGITMDYKEAVLLNHPSNPSLLGQYFASCHYAGEDLRLTFAHGEPWKKVFGPVFIHLNSVSDGQDAHQALWAAAKQQMHNEVQKWPYSFPASTEFSSANQRGSVIRRLLVQNGRDVPANLAYVGLSLPGDAGSWQRESKVISGIPILDESWKRRAFPVNHIRAEDYNLYAWITGFIGDYKYNAKITISPGLNVNVGDIVYTPPRDGPTLWEIGVPDRSADEFYIPPTNPKYASQLLLHGSHMKTENNMYQGTRWSVKFRLSGGLNRAGVYKLRVALASATLAELQVRVNSPIPKPPLFTTGLIGYDSAVARHGVHGLYWLYNEDIPGSRLVEGDNTIFLTQSRYASRFCGLMYDYIRLERPL
ncbi:hypothetical protein GIB67_005619 [Kingdonia uniflora]|uniref:Rhamnogalacturonan lyase domain-containing protein n=1 Tax=Kingdonia uniflora TaxID=39325 RepID=A0A7J7NI40_9MAGN|nr:hypothetical protein GIB67_005619 [Kingdonia uniflora]